MSLSSLLIPKKKTIDTELDALFTSTVTSPPVPGPSKDTDGKKKKKKRKLEPDDVTEPPPDSRAKRPRDGPSTKALESGSEKKGKSPAKTKDGAAKEKAKRGGKGKGKAKATEDSDGEDNNSDLENAYLKTGKDAAPDDDDEEQEAFDVPVHESLKKKSKKAAPKPKFIPVDETPELRDQRTIFIGNLPVDIAQKRPLLKQLQRHILAHVPTARIESTRFRSIAFQTPTSKLPAADDDGAHSSPAKSQPTPQPPKPARPHERERALTWRERQGGADDDTGRSDDKQYLDSKQKKKIAFINQEFHSTADTINAYVVFAHPQPVEGRPANLPPPPPTLDPYEAARAAAEKCDGTLFLERMIRVDMVGRKDAAGPRDGEGEGVLLVGDDPKLSVFVGNLEFASKEEDLRVFFEGVVSAERGPPGDDDSGHEDEAAPRKPRTWVTRVRIVRDKETQLGKGFAYVQFAERECVDEVLALDDTKLRFAKRKLRVQRCKSASAPVRPPAVGGSGAPTRPAPVPIVIPRGDPRLGEKLAHLPKDERKQAKSADADRVARRLAKKRARNALGNSGVRPQGKDRERVRKAPAVGKSKSAPRKKESGKKRVRSDRSLAKLNGKK